MNKKIYFIVLVIFAAAGGFVNTKVGGLMADDVPECTCPADSVEAAQAGTDVVLTNRTAEYAAGTRFWTPRRSRNVISEYDQIIRQVAAGRGYDWRFISAIAYAESQFDHDVVSYAGAVGLMQIMPVVARQFEVDPMHVGDPHTNITLGIELLDYIGRTLRFSRSTSETDRLSIILASYNCGIGHVLDARRLAAKHGENHNSWSVVAKYLRLKSQPDYYGDEAVRCGAFYDNGQTLGFVRKVLRYYDSYCEMAAL